MDDYLEVSSDTSNETVVLENNELDNILQKYNSNDFSTNIVKNTASNTKYLDGASNKDVNNLTTKNSYTSKNIYNLDDFSDDEFNYEPLETRLKNVNVNKNKPDTFNSNSSWQDKFSTDDFCEDSNDIDAVLNRISQLESEQFQGTPRQELSKEVESLITGNIIEKPKPKELVTTNAKNSYQWSESSEEDNCNLNNLKNDFKFDARTFEVESLKCSNSSVESNSEDILVEPKKKRPKKKPCDKEAQKLEKELAKAAKVKEREQKKLEKENQKQLKNALRVVENSVKPDQCIQYITVNLDENISNKPYGEVVKASLNNGGYNYKVSKQLVPNLISWVRKVPTLENMLLQNVFQQEKHYLLIMETPEFILHIVNHTLVGHIQSLLSMQEIQHLTIAILGLQRYYKYLKEEKNKEFKAAVAESDSNKKTTNIEFRDLPKASKRDVEVKLVELQILCKNIYVRPVEKYEDLAVFVGECTKSVGQIPYKTAKHQLLQHESEYFTVDNRDCVRIDKDGNGLSRLWNQFLRMFPLASLETAEAVSSVYPTIHSLMEAYKNCESSEQAEKLLQDLPVRRAAGPLSGQRRIGPEFSKKAYKFFCSEENVLL